jgi:hypothetical protein
MVYNCDDEVAARARGSQAHRMKIVGWDITPCKKVKISLLQTMEAHRVARG